MQYVLFVWGALAGFVGFVTWSVSRSAVHEIEAAVCFLIATVAIGCAAIVQSLKKSQTAGN